MSLFISKKDDVTVIALGSGYEYIDQDTISGLEAKLLELSRSVDPPLIVVDLSQTSFFASSFLALLVRVWQEIKPRGGQLAVTGLTPHCAEVFEHKGFSRIWATFPSEDEAVRAFSVHQSV